MAVTAHWIARHDGKLALRTALIGFHHMRGKHTGERIGNGIFQVAERAGISEKVSVTKLYDTLLTILDRSHNHGQCE